MLGRANDITYSSLFTDKVSSTVHMIIYYGTNDSIF